MANEFDHTTKFKADISDLKAGITEANKQLKKISSEYKAASSQAKLMGDKQAEIKSKLEYLSKTLEQQKNKLESYKKQLETTKNYTEQLGQKETELAKKLEEAKQKYGDNSTEVKKYNQELANVQKEISSNQDKMEKLNVTINNQQAICNNTEKELNDYNQELQDMGNNVDDAVVATDELGGGLGSISDAVTAASQALSGVGEIVDGLTDKFESLLVNGINKTIDGMKLLTENAFNSGVSYEAAMSQVIATMGLSKQSKEYEKLSKAAKEYGATTKFTATQAAEALNYLALAGYQTDDAISLLPTILNLASAGGMELAAASDMVTDAMSALGLEMGDATKFTDQLAKASTKSNTSVAQLGEAILTIGATAQGMKNGTVELSTSLGILADSSAKSSEGGTKLRNILLSLENPTKDAAELMKKLGIEVYDSEGNLNGLNNIFGQFSDAMDGFTNKQKDNVLATVFNGRDVAAARQLLKNCGERFNELSADITNCDGAAQKMSDTMNDNLQGSIFSIQSAVEGFGIAMYEKLETPARSVIDSLTSTIRGLIDDINNGDGLSGAFDMISDSMKNFASQLPDLIEKHLPDLEKIFTGIAKIIATLIDYLPQIIDTILPKLVDIIDKVITKLPDLLENELPKVIDLVGWVIDNLPTLLTILYSIKAILAVLQTVLSGLGLAALVSKLIEVFGAGGAIASAGATISGLFATIGGWLSGIGTAIAGVGSTIIEVLSGPVGWVILVITAVIAAVTLLYKKCEPFKNFVDNLAKTIKDFFSNLWDNIKSFSFSDFIDGITDKFDELGNKIKEKWSDFKDGAKNKFSEIKNSISTTLSDIVTNVVTFIKELPDKIIEGIGFIIGYALGTNVRIMKSIKETISNIWDSIVNFFKNLPEMISTGFKNLYDTWVAFKTNLFTTISTFISETKEKVANFITNLPTMLQNGFNTLIQNCITFFSNLIYTIGVKFGEIYSSVSSFLQSLPSLISNALKTLWDKIVAFKNNVVAKINELLSKIGSFAKDIINKFKSIDLKEIGKNIIQGLINGIESKWKALKSKIDKFTSGIKKGFQSALDIHSPSRWMRDFIGKNLMEGLTIGIDKNADGVLNSISNLSSELLNSFDVNMFKDLDLGSVSGSISNKTGSSNNITNNTSSVTYNPTFNYNKPLNSREIYRQNKNMLNAVLSK